MKEFLEALLCACLVAAIAVITAYFVIQAFMVITQ